MDRKDLQDLGSKALACMLDQKPVTITRHTSEPRNGFPLPIKKVDRATDGYITQQYRPLAILEYINDALSGELASRQAKRRNKETA